MVCTFDISDELRDLTSTPVVIQVIKIIVIVLVITINNDKR